MKNAPSKGLKIEIKGNHYEITYPTTGQFIDIAVLKSKIANEYRSLASATDYNMGYAKVLVDMIATFNVLLPDLKKDLNINAILDLSLLESRQLLDPYIEIYLPWITEFLNMVTAINKKDAEKAIA
jgi:hypothetical protein